MRLIWDSFDMQDGTVVEIWLSKDSAESKFDFTFDFMFDFTFEISIAWPKSRVICLSS